MQKVRGSNPLSSTIFRVPVRGKSAKLLALDHRLTWANAELRTVAFYAECQGPNRSSPYVMHAQHPNDPDPDPTERSSTRCGPRACSSVRCPRAMAATPRRSGGRPWLPAESTEVGHPRPDRHRAAWLAGSLTRGNRRGPADARRSVRLVHMVRVLVAVRVSHDLVRPAGRVRRWPRRAARPAGAWRAGRCHLSAARPALRPW